MKSLIVRIPLAFLVLAASAPLFAQGDEDTPVQRAQKMIETADSDGDGQLSRAEAKANFPILWRNFDQVDTDNSGKLSLDEIKVFVQQRATDAGQAMKRVRALRGI